MVRNFLISIISSFLLSTPLFSQDHQWWANNVDWDGISHWSTYITYSPGKMGPNAIPIANPIGIFPKTDGLSLSLKGFGTQGEQTLSTHLDLLFSLIPEKLRVGIEVLPMEFFQTSHELKTDRNVFWTNYNRKRANGDMQIHTLYTLRNEGLQKPKIDLRINYRFPTSNGIGAARFTDSPGYYFDLGFEKTWITRRMKTKHIKKWFFNLGFHAWQTNQANQLQDDALLFGLGQKWESENRISALYVKGFYGYLNNGDRPIICGATIQKAQTHYTLEYGLNDYPFVSIGIRHTLFSSTFFNTFQNLYVPKPGI